MTTKTSHALSAAALSVGGESAEWVTSNAREVVRLLTELRGALPPVDFRLGALQELADDLLEMHEETGVSLDGWVSAREFVEAYHGPITENGA